MFLALEVHTSAVYISIHLQGLFKPPERSIRVRKIGLHDENVAF